MCVTSALKNDRNPISKNINIVEIICRKKVLPLTMSVVGYVLNIVCHPFRRCANLMWCMAQQWHDVDRSFLVLDHHSQVLLDRGVNLSEPARGEHKRIHWRQQAVAFNLLTYAWVATTTFSFLLWLSGFGNGSNKWEEGHWLHFWSLSLRTDIFICIGCKLSRRPFRNIFNGILTKNQRGKKIEKPAAQWRHAITN